MSCLSGNCQKGTGAILTVVISEPKIISDLAQKKDASPMRTPPKGMRPYRGLLDTGASRTCISPKVAEEVGLQARGMMEMVSASGTTPRQQYLFALGLPMGTGINPSGEEEGRILFPFPPIEGLDFDAGRNLPFDVLVGMDIIMHGSLKIDFDGHFSFCF